MKTYKVNYGSDGSGITYEVPQIIKDFRFARENGASIDSVLSAFPLKK